MPIRFILVLFVIFAVYILFPINSVFSQGPPVPSMVCLGSCPTVPQGGIPSPPTAPNATPTIFSAPLSPTNFPTVINNPIPPCINTQTNNINSYSQSEQSTITDHKKQQQDTGFIQIILQILNQLIQLILQLLGGIGLPVPTPVTPTPSMPVSIAPSQALPTNQPAPTNALPTTGLPPCPTIQPTNVPISITSVPLSPTIQPSVTITVPSQQPTVQATVQPTTTQKAVLIVEELFPDNNLGARGWHPNYSKQPIKLSMPVTFDATLNKNFMRFLWTGGSQDPVGYSESMFLDFPKTHNDVTVRYFAKIVAWGKWGQDNHFLGIFLHPFNWAQRNEVYYEPANHGTGRNFQLGLDSVAYGTRWDEQRDTSTDNILQMGTWYEFRGHFKTNTAGSSDGEYILEMKPASGGNWTQIVNHTRKNWPRANGYNPSGFGSIGIRPHMHAGGTGEIHLASYQVFEGNQLRTNL